MATKITLTLTDDLNEKQQHQLRGILKDAFHEFATKRYPSDVYVENRYPGMSDAERAEKSLQVSERSLLARSLHDAAFDATIAPSTSLAMSLAEIDLILHESLHAGLLRLALVDRVLQMTFGMTEMEAKGVVNRLEDQRIDREIAGRK